MTEPDTVYSGVENLDRLAELARNYNRFLVRTIERSCRNAPLAVDFGAGTGTFASALLKRGRQVACVETDPALRRRLEEQGFTCHATLSTIPEESLDFVFSLNVLEHIEDDAGALREIARRLKPGGTLFLYVPAFNVLFSSMDRKVGHYRRYTKGTLIPRLQQAGFKIRNARYADSLGYAASLWFKWFGNPQGALNPRALWLYDRLAFPLSRLLDALVGHWLGKNLAVTAVRNSCAKKENIPA